MPPNDKYYCLRTCYAYFSFSVTTIHRKALYVTSMIRKRTELYTKPVWCVSHWLVPKFPKALDQRQRRNGETQVVSFPDNCMKTNKKCLVNKSTYNILEI